MSHVGSPLWQPSAERIAASQLRAFTDQAERASGRRFDDYAALHHWSVECPETFWLLVWSFCDVVAAQRGTTVLLDSDCMPGARWFPDARLNFAENLLRRRDAAPALVFRSETGLRREISFADLYAMVSRVAAALRSLGVVPGDRIAGYLPNVPEAVIAMLAAAALGAIWSSCSPDFGARSVTERFGSIDPKVLFAADGYFYAGKVFGCLETVRELTRVLPTLRHTVIVPYAEEGAARCALPEASSFEEFIAGHAAADLSFEQFGFDHPLYVLYSSGTTGPPKGIVHSAGGTLLQHLKEHRLHVNLAATDRLFYFTTCGWMMWNWLVSGLASGATLVLYDGSPLHPHAGTLFDLAERERVTVFGTSAKFLASVAKAGVEPVRGHRLEALHTLLSTGSPLPPEGFDYVYAKVKSDVLLASISGGTDIISCFVLGNPTLPVWRGEIQCAGLGMKVEVVNDAGEPVVGTPGELVCSAPFPSMPVGFWNDPDGSRYRASYFERFPGRWHHGDRAEQTGRGGFIIHGRSDAVLNPGGVRIGTAEIYRHVERLDEIVESVAIGQEWGNDIRVVLFIKLRPGLVADDALLHRIRRVIRENATPRHVPARIIQVADIPRTRNGKISELAVREVVHGRPVKNVDALENPESLDHFRDCPQLAL